MCLRANQSDKNVLSRLPSFLPATLTEALNPLSISLARILQSNSTYRKGQTFGGEKRSLSGRGNEGISGNFKFKSNLVRVCPPRKEPCRQSRNAMKVQEPELLRFLREESEKEFKLMPGQTEE